MRLNLHAELLHDSSLMADFEVPTGHETFWSSWPLTACLENGSHNWVTGHLQQQKVFNFPSPPHQPERAKSGWAAWVVRSGLLTELFGQAWISMS